MNCRADVWVSWKIGKVVANCISASVWVSWKIGKVRVYRFHGKVKKEKALNHHKQENNKKGCVEKFTER